jgi:hypothetical protein
MHNLLNAPTEKKSKEKRNRRHVSKDPGTRADMRVDNSDICISGTTKKCKKYQKMHSKAVKCEGSKKA